MTKLKLTKGDHADIEKIRQALGPTEPVPGPTFAEMDEHLQALVRLLTPRLSISSVAPEAITAWNNLRQLCIEVSDDRPLHEKWTNYPKPLGIVED